MAGGRLPPSILRGVRVLTDAERAGMSITLRCPFCLTLNRIDLQKAGDRPKCGSCHKPLLLDRPVKVAEEDFEHTVLAAEVLVLVDFYADWCAPCKAMAPILDEIAKKGEGRLLVAKIDTDRAPELSVKLEIRGIPTLIAFRAGREIGRTVGFDPGEIQDLLERVA